MESLAIQTTRVTSVVVWAVAVALAGVVSCRPATTGGDIPVTEDRLRGSRLVGLQHDVSWAFVGGDVVIDNGGRSIPEDVVGEIIGARPAPKAIEARWMIDASAGVLRLSDVKVDGEAFTGTPRVPIRPAGQVRITLGRRQYNRGPVVGIH